MVCTLKIKVQFCNAISCYYERLVLERLGLILQSLVGIFKTGSHITIFYDGSPQLLPSFFKGRSSSNKGHAVRASIKAFLAALSGRPPAGARRERRLARCSAHRGTQWATIAQNVKKPPLRLNVIDFIFLVLMYAYGSLGVLLVPKSHDTLGRIIQIYKICGENKVHFAPFIRYH